MGAACHLALHGLHDGGVRVAEQQRSVAAQIVNVLIAIFVPLAGALGVDEEDRERCGVPCFVRHAVGQQCLPLLIQLGGRGVEGAVTLKDGTHTVLPFPCTT